MKKKSVLIVSGVVIGVLFVVGIFGTAAYLVYKNYIADGIPDGSQSVSSEVTEFEAQENPGSIVTDISDEKLDSVVQILTTANIAAQNCMPVDYSEIETLKEKSAFYIYLNFENPIEITIDGYDEYDDGRNIEVPEIYIWGPNDEAASLHVLDEASGKWLCYGLWNIEDEKDLYEIVFDKEYDAVLAGTIFEIPEINTIVTLDGDYCSFNNNFEGEPIEGNTDGPVPGSAFDEGNPEGGAYVGGENGFGGEQYYRIDCNTDNIRANAKIMVNPLITGGGFGFDAAQMIDPDKRTETFEEVTIMGKTYIKRTISGEGSIYGDEYEGSVDDNRFTFTEVYFAPELTEESTPVFELGGSTVIFGYEVKVLSQQIGTSEYENMLNALDNVFLNMEKIK